MVTARNKNTSVQTDKTTHELPVSILSERDVMVNVLCRLTSASPATAMNQKYNMRTQPTKLKGVPGVAVQAVVVPMGKRAERNRAKILAAITLEHLICDGCFDDTTKPVIWTVIDKLRAQREKRHNSEVRHGGE